MISAVVALLVSAAHAGDVTGTWYLDRGTVTGTAVVTKVDADHFTFVIDAVTESLNFAGGTYDVLVDHGRGAGRGEYGCAFTVTLGETFLEIEDPDGTCQGGIGANIDGLYFRDSQQLKSNDPVLSPTEFKLLRDRFADFRTADDQLNSAYQRALVKFTGAELATLRAEQRQWTKERDRIAFEKGYQFKSSRPYIDELTSQTRARTDALLRAVNPGRLLDL